MTRTHVIDATLRSLDAANCDVDPAGARARTDLHSILATDPAPDSQGQPWAHSTGARRPVRSARTARRVAMVGAMAAAVTAGMVVLPSLTRGDQAFATWTAAPAGMSAQQRLDAAAECREHQQGGAGAEYADDLVSAEPVIAERRGAWTTVVLADTDGLSALCIADDSAHLFADDMIGSIGVTTDDAAPGPRELVATDLGTGTMSAGDISLAAGRAGPDVVGVVYRSQAHGDVTATVTDGHFALWFPGDELMDAAKDGIEVVVTHRDGTTDTRRMSL